MNEPIEDSASVAHSPLSKINLAINIISAPSEAFSELAKRPSKLFPLALVLISNALVLAWYFNIVDFDWYVDDVLSAANLEDDELEEAREAMGALSPTSMMGFSMLGSMVGVTVIFVLQSTYLSLVSALRGDNYKFTHWFSLVSWTALPFLLSTIGMAVTIMLSPTGQLSVYELDPLALRNLGMQSENSSLQALYSAVSLSMLWSIVLIALGHKQWTESSWLRTGAVVFGPYLLIVGVWTYIALA